MSATGNKHNRYLELLADSVVQPLTGEQQAELIMLKSQLDNEQIESDQFEFEYVAALVDQAFQPELTDDMPSDFSKVTAAALTQIRAESQQDLTDSDAASTAEKNAARIPDVIQQGNTFQPDQDIVDFAARLQNGKHIGNSGSRREFGLFAIAATLVMAILVLVLVDTREDVADSAGVQRTALLQHTDTIQIDWGVPDIPEYAQVEGDVIWNNTTQSGFMRLRNMPVNDPGQSQYQLWIVDPERDANPVDGGVFDIASNGEVIIPIDSKLAIKAPAAFAITREQPGGVVVSAGPLLVVAAVEA